MSAYEFILKHSDEHHAIIKGVVDIKESYSYTVKCWGDVGVVGDFNVMPVWNNSTGEKYFFMDIFVTPEMRGKGIAYNMMNVFFENIAQLDPNQGGLDDNTLLGIDTDASSLGEDDKGGNFWSKFLKDTEEETGGAAEKGNQLSIIRDYISNKLAEGSDTKKHSKLRKHKTKRRRKKRRRKKTKRRRKKTKRRRKKRRRKRRRKR